MIAKAQKFIQKGNLDKALAEYRAVAAIDPNDITIGLRIGELCVKTGRKEEAIKEYSNVARANTHKGFYLKAIAVYKQVLKLDDTILEVHYKLAELYGKQKLVVDAISEFSYLANYYEKSGKPGEVVPLYKMMVDVDPENIGVRLKLAEEYQKQNFDKDALAEYAIVYNKLITDDKFDKAERIYLDLFNIYPNEPQVVLGLADIYKSNGDDMQYLKFTRKLFDIHSGEGNSFDAITAKEDILKLESKNPDAVAFIEKFKESSGEASAKAPEDAGEARPEESVAEVTPEVTPEAEPEAEAEAEAPAEAEEEVEISLDGFDEEEDEAPQVAEAPAVEEAPEAEDTDPALEEAFKEAAASIDKREAEVEEEAEVEVEVEEPAAIEEVIPEVAETPVEEEVIEKVAPVEEEVLEEAAPVEEEPPVVEEEAAPVEEEAAVEEEVLEEAAPVEEEVPVVEEEAASIEEEAPVEEEVLEEAAPVEEEAPVVEEEAAPVEEELPVEGVHDTAEEAISEAIDELMDKMEPGADLVDTSSSGKVSDEGAAPESGDEYVDLSAELGIEESAEVSSPQEGSAIASETYNEVRTGLEKQLNSEDSETHYNLGIAYMEMELFKEASKEFKLASKDPGLAFDCFTRLGLSALAESEYDEAIGYYLKAMKVEGRTEDERRGCLYELALAYEANSNLEEAAGIFKSIHEVDPGYREVAEKVSSVAEGATELIAEPMGIPMDDGLIEVEFL